MTTTASVLMEENNQKGDFNIASKNVGSFVKINSISIDLADVNAKSNDGKCDHFSIRGYVSEVRKKNWKLCWPFDLDDEQNKLKEQTSLLPPLTSPKFRYWSCKCCVEKFDCTGTGKDHGTRSNNCTNTLSKSKSDCCHIPSPCSTTMPLPNNAHQALKTNLAEEQKDGVCASTDRDSKHIHQDKKALVSAQVHTSFTGSVNGSANVAGNEFPGITSVPEEINLNVMQEKPECDAESRKDEETRSVDLFEHSREKYDVTDVARATPVGACETSTLSCVAENPFFVDERLDKLKIASGSSTLAGSSDGAAKKSKKNTNGCVAGLLDDRDHTSSDSMEIVGSRGVQGHKSSSPSGPQRRRARKIRLLTELLLESGEAKTEKASKDISPVRVVNGESTGAGVSSVLQGQKSSPDNCKDNGSNDNKKRKFPRDDEWKSPDINLNKKLKSFKESEGNDASAQAGPEIKGDASTGLYPQVNRKAQWSKHGSDKLPLSDKRKNRKRQTGVNVHSYLVPVGENFRNPGLDGVGNSNKGNVQDGVSFRAVNEASASRGLDKTSLSTPRMEKKASFTKSKGKMPKLDSVRSSQYHWNDAGSVKSSPTVRNEETIQSGSLHVPFRQVEEASIDTGLQLSLGGSAAPIKCNWKYTQDGDGKSPLVWQEGMPVDETMKKMVERNYISEPTVPPKAIAYPFYKKRAHDDVHGQFVTYTVPVLNEKQNNSSQTEGRRSLGKHVDTSGPNNGLKTIKVKEHPALSRKGAVEIADRASEKGSADEFPMDIVELLARIQYEKGLPVPENRKNLLKVANEGRKTAMVEYDRLYSADRFRIPEDTSKRTNPQARNGRTEVATARKSIKPIKQKLVEQFPNGNGDHVNGGHLAQKKSSSAIQISGSGPTECSCAQNCQWNANMLGHGFLNTSVQRGACNTCPVGQRSMGEAAQAWPSAVPLERPTKYIVPPQKVGPPRNNIQIASSGPSLQHKGDYMSREQELKYQKHYATNLEMPSQHVVSETFSQRNTEYTYVNKHNRIEHQQNLRGSLDLYSNETIPAMHLLSLVTAGLSSAGPTFKAPGNAKFFEGDCPENNSKEYPQMMAGVYNKPKDVAKDPIDNHGKNQLVVKSHDFFPVKPMAGPSSSSFRQEKGLPRANDFMGQVPFSSRGKEKVQKSSAALPVQNRGKALNSAYASGGYSPSHSAVPVHVTQKGFIGASSSMVPLLQPRTTEYPTELRLGSPHATGTFRPLKSRTEFMVCSVNRNPADFSVPGAENEYMIRGEDLKVKKSRKRRGSATLDQQRPQKQAKRTADKERT